MDAQSLTYLFVALSFGLYIGIAIWSRAGSTNEFYVAGGGVHPNCQRHGYRRGLDECGFLHFHGRNHRLYGL